MATHCFYLSNHVNILKYSSSSITIEDALRLAIDAHDGLEDLDGNPAILHPLTVGLMGTTREEQIAGFLHDVVEDSDLSFEDLQTVGIDAPIIESQRMLTRPEGMDYFDYVQRIVDSGNKIALRVKRHDLEHNLLRGRAGNHTRQVKKYERAWEMMKGR